MVAAKAATCTTAGNSAYYTCDGCDKWFADATGSVEITDKTSVKIPAPGHTAGTEWKSDDTNHWHECSRCHDKKDEAAHDYGSDNVCDTCGYDKTVVTTTTKPTTATTTKPTTATTVTEPAGILGDVNGDGIVNVKDASAIQKYAAEMTVELNLKLADYNKDGYVNVKDATDIQKTTAFLN